MIRSVGLWQFDEHGNPQRLHAWARAAVSAAPAAVPVPDASWRTMGLHAPTSGTVIASCPFGTEASQVLVVLDCASLPDTAAALEHWRLAAPDGAQLTVHDAWYNAQAQPMALVSRHSRIGLGFGLPGLAAQLGYPVYLGNLGNSDRFIRAWSAMQVQMHHGLALPAPDGRDVLVLLTGARLTSARRIELSVVEPDGIRRLLGFCQREGDLDVQMIAAPWGADRLRACAASGLAMLDQLGSDSRFEDTEMLDLGATALLALPYAGPESQRVVLALWM